MDERISEMVSALKRAKIPTYKIESDLGFSNGLLSKGGLSEEKFKKLCEYYNRHLKGEDGVLYCYTVYQLLDENNEVFYVGITRQQLETRLACHVSDSTRPQYVNPSKKEAKISKMISCGYYPKIEPLELVKNKSLILLFDEVVEREKYWIDKLVNEGRELCNNKALVAKIKRGGSALSSYPKTILPPTYFDAMIKLQDLTKPNLEIKPIEAAKSNFKVQIPKKEEKPVIEEKTVSDEKKEDRKGIQEQIEELTTQMNNCGTTYFGKRMKESLQKQINELKNKSQQ